MSDLGADPALAKAEPVARLGPSGFDPGEERLFVHAGKCRFCEVGIPVERTDMCGKPLHTGDIVVIWTDGGLTVPDHLTVVVRQDFQTYNDGTPEGYHEPLGPSEPFVMGLKTVPLDDTGEWNVLKVKSYADVIPGERWTAYGFNYVLARIETRSAET